MSARLERSRNNRVVGGVCGGIGEYLDIDPTFVRVVMIILAFPFGIGLLIYFVLLFLMPTPGEVAPFVRPAAPADPADPTASAVVTPRPTPLEDPLALERRRNALGILLVGLGAVFMLANLGAFRFIDWRYIWPLVLIAVGAFLIVGRTRR